MQKAPRYTVAWGFFCGNGKVEPLLVTPVELVDYLWGYSGISMEAINARHQAVLRGAFIILMVPNIKRMPDKS
jgi:hypothetical protein